MKKQHSFAGQYTYRISRKRTDWGTSRQGRRELDSLPRK